MSHSYDYVPDENTEFECDRCGASLRAFDKEREELQIANGEHFECYLEAQG